MIVLFFNINFIFVVMGIIKVNMEVIGKKFLMVGGDVLYIGEIIFNGGVVVNNLVFVVFWFFGG